MSKAVRLLTVNDIERHTMQMNRLTLIAGMSSLVGIVCMAYAGPFSTQFEQGTKNWNVVLDGVMGGRSSGIITHNNSGNMTFTGKLSLENNGGFSQIRRPVERDSFNNSDGVEIRVRGDGRDYKFDIRVSNYRFMATSFQTDFRTIDDQWITFKLPYDSFELQTFGRKVPGNPQINPSRIESIGITLADYNEGSFALEIESIIAYSDSPSQELRPTTQRTASQDDPYQRRLDLLANDLGLTQSDPNQDQPTVYENRVAKLTQSLGSSTQAKNQTETQPKDMYAGRQARLVDLLNERAIYNENTLSHSVVNHRDSISEFCELAINRGAPLFNNGQIAACAAVYEITLKSFVELGSNQFDEHMNDELNNALTQAKNTHDMRERAWIYRRAIDTVYKAMSSDFVAQR
jgi:NADH dehydrogenase [ubiquinone] 1 alpha subcomplex assembly factor 1